MAADLSTAPQSGVVFDHDEAELALTSAEAAAAAETAGEAVAEETCAVTEVPDTGGRWLAAAAETASEAVAEEIGAVTALLHDTGGRWTKSLTGGTLVDEDVGGVVKAEDTVAKVGGRGRGRTTTGRGRGKPSGRSATTGRGRGAGRTGSRATAGHARSVKKAEAPTGMAARPAAAGVAKGAPEVEAEAELPPPPPPPPLTPPTEETAALADAVAAVKDSQPAAAVEVSQPASPGAADRGAPTRPNLTPNLDSPMRPLTDPAGITHVTFFVDTLVDVFQDMFVFKASFMIIGWALHTAVTATMDHLIYDTPIGLQGESTGALVLAGGSGNIGYRLALFAISTFTFVTMLALAAGLARLVNSAEKLSDRARKSLLLSLGLLPIWAYIDLVRYFIEAMTETLRPEKDTTRHIFNAGLSVLVAVIGAAIQTCAEGKFQGSFFVAPLKTSVGAGVAVSLNMFVEAVLEAFFRDKLLYLISYVALMSAVVSLVMAHAIHSSEEKDYMTRVDTLLGTDLLSRARDLYFLSGNLLVGFAWKSTFDCIFRGWMQESVLGQLKVSLCVSAVTMSMAAVVAMWGRGLPKFAHTTLTLVSGFLSGWTWVDFIAAAASEWAKDVPRLLVICFITILICFSFALLAEYLLRPFLARLQRSLDENDGKVASEP